MRERILVEIMGKPFAQPRPQMRLIEKGGKTFPIAYDPKTAKRWKAYAADVMKNYADKRGNFGAYELKPLQGPLRLQVFALWALPKSYHRKTPPIPKREFFTSPRDDYDNVLKAIGDAGNGILWDDDGQIAKAEIECVLGDQTDAARVQLIVSELGDEDIPTRDLFEREL